MNTDDLVAALARGADAVDPQAARRRLLMAILAGGAAAVALVLGILGPRPNLSDELSVPMFWAREAFCAALGVLAISAMRRLAHPGLRLGWLPWGLAVPFAAIWAMAAVALIGADAPDRAALILGQTAKVCSMRITWISVPLFIAFVWVVKGLAPTRLRLAGAACGLAAGAVGALAYTLHCPELAAPFLGIWYVVGMLVPTGVGALLGPRLLRW